MTKLQRMQFLTPVPIQPFFHPVLDDAKVSMSVLREDQNHAILPGNKARKLVYNLEAARGGGHNTLLTFGGAYSNHIRATAIAGKAFGFSTVGVIRGQELADVPLNSSLTSAVDNGMVLKFVSRDIYRQKAEKTVLKEIVKGVGCCYILPEGGSNALAVKGAAEMVTSEMLGEFDVICVACGTGGTLAGLIMGMEGKKSVLGVAVLKNGGFLVKEVSRLLCEAGSELHSNWEIDLDSHFGGYAKFSNELNGFLRTVKAYNPHIPLEPIYTGRLLHCILNRVQKRMFSPGTKILMVHTGGIQ